MAFLQWRRFTFFDKEIVKDIRNHEDVSKPFEIIKESDIVACASGRGRIICGDLEGNIHLISRDLDVMTFKAFAITLSHLHPMRQSPFLVSIGIDEPGVNPLIKIWNLDKIVERTGWPTCVRIARAIPGNIPSHATTLAVNDSLTAMAVGFENGSVIIFKGDVTRDGSRHNKAKVIHEGRHPITGLHFRNTAKQNHLFVVTSNDCYSYNLSAKEKEHKFQLDDIGCPVKCTTLTDFTQDTLLVMANEKAVYFFQPDGRGPCLGFEGQKMILHWYRGYLVIVSENPKAVAMASSSTVSGICDSNVVSIYDVQNKFMAYSASVPHVIDVIHEWGSLYLVCKDKKLYHLQERDTQNKLETLFKKNLYALAIQLAKGQQYDEDGLVEIFRQYGDHLNNKGDYDGAVAQYILTIGKLEPSYVIRKFLDAQKIHNLTAYLQELHKKGLANEDHTTLLLNCYTKLKDIDRLDEFIMTKDREVDFDVDTAIKVCRQAGYYQHSLTLAEKHQQHDWYLKIQLEDLKNYHTALDYIGKLEFHQAEQNMKKYGKILLNKVPVQTTELLKRLCTDYIPADKPLVNIETFDGSRSVQVKCSSAEEFIHIYVNNTTKLTEFLEHMIKLKPNCRSSVYNTLIEVYLREYQTKETEGERKLLEQKLMDLFQRPEASYDMEHCLALCQVNNFRPGLLLLYEKAKLYQQILHYHMDYADHSGVILACNKYGSQQPSLWVEALRYFACCHSDDDDHLLKVLNEVEKKKLLSPLIVIDIMSNSPSVTLGVIKDYVIRQLQQENGRIAEDERLIKQYRDETERMRSQIDEIKTSARIFQVTKCSTCNHTLELPSVHFLCQHSYHQHCFDSYSDGESECIVCMAENRKVMDILRTQEQSRDMHEQFHNQLERADDSFAVVAEYFGRGVFTDVTLIPETVSKRKPKQKVDTNPFNHYDKKLNPFED
ncbi:Vacuolar protein sorting-associated protein 11 [Chamberlinius hualienensis]